MSTPSSILTSLIANWSVASAVSFNAQSGAPPLSTEMTLSQWNDLTGNGFHLTTSGAGSSPSYNRATGTPWIPVSIEGRGDNNYFNIPSGVSVNGQSCGGFIICEAQNQSGTVASLISIGSGAPAIAFQIGTNLKLANLGNAASGAGLVSNALALYVFSCSGTTMTCYQSNPDGTMHSGTRANSALNTSYAGGQICAYNSSSSYTTPMVVYEAGITNAPITSAQAASLLGYAQAQYALASFTPANLLAVFGDSIGCGWAAERNNGWVRRLGKLLLGNTLVYNISYSGGTTSQINALIATQSALVLPSALNSTAIYAAATNDLINTGQAATAIANTQTGLSDLATAGFKNIFLKTVGPRSVGTNGNYTADAATVNAAYKANYASWGATGIIDDTGIPALSALNSAYFWDTVHPNDDGHELIAIKAAEIILPYQVTAGNLQCTDPGVGNVTSGKTYLFYGSARTGAAPASGNSSIAFSTGEFKR